MADWVLEHVPPETRPYVLEVGSGNGTLLFALRATGYDGARLAGVDYSLDAVKLARLIAADRGSEDGLISFSECDFLSEVPAPVAGLGSSVEGWDLLLDKGTYDAIALGEKDADGKSPVAGYPARVSKLLKDGGHFLITCVCFQFPSFDGYSCFVSNSM